MNPLETTLEKVGRVLSEEYGIRVQCQGNRCCTDGKVIYLPALPDSIPDELFQAIRGYLDHESAHVAGRSDFRVGAEFKSRLGSEAFGLLNTLEDLRIEEYMAKKYPGSAVNLANAYRYAARIATEQHEHGIPLPAMKQLAFAIHARAHRLPDQPFVDAAVRTAADAIASEIHQSVNAPNTKTVAKLAESAWATVAPLLQSPPAADGQSDGQAGKDTSASGKASARNDTAGGEDGGSPPVTDKAKSGSRRKSGASSSKRNDAGSGDQSTPSTDNTGSGQSISSGASVSTTSGDVDSSGIMGGLARDIAASVARHATTNSQYRVWTTEHDTVTVPADTSIISHAERMAPLMRHVSGVRQKLIQTLLAETRVRWLPDQPEGRLNPRALHRLATANWLAQHGNSNAAQEQAEMLTKNVFRRKVVAKRLKTAVTLLIDVSHSMSVRKLDLAKATALILCESLARLNIPVSVIAFSTEHQGKRIREAVQATGIPAEELEKQFRFAPLVFEIFKGFHESFRRISGRFDSLRTHLMTPLGESVLFAARELARRPEPRKVLLVITDGRPTVGLDNDTITFRHAKDSIIRVEKAGIETVLVGILESCVRDLHHRSVVVDSLEDLPGTVMNQLRQLLVQSSQITYRDTRASA